MERLTERIKTANGEEAFEFAKCEFEMCSEVCARVSGCHECPIEEALIKLTEYEETGLTPAQITEIDNLYSEKCAELAKMKENIIHRMNKRRLELQKRIAEDKDSYNVLRLMGKENDIRIAIRVLQEVMSDEQEDRA